MKTIVPPYDAERFMKAFEDFVSEIRASVAEGTLNPAYTLKNGFLMWQIELLPRFEQELTALRNAFALFQTGETEALVRLADYQRGLGKHLDGVPLDFAGSEHAKVLDQLETAVVVTAYQLLKNSYPK